MVKNDDSVVAGGVFWYTKLVSEHIGLRYTYDMQAGVWREGRARSLNMCRTEPVTTHERDCRGSWLNRRGGRRGWRDVVCCQRHEGQVSIAVTHASTRSMGEEKSNRSSSFALTTAVENSFDHHRNRERCPRYFIETLPTAFHEIHCWGGFTPARCVEFSNVHLFGTI